jgi:hypothetical protein
VTLTATYLLVNKFASNLGQTLIPTVTDDHKEVSGMTEQMEKTGVRTGLFIGGRERFTGEVLGGRSREAGPDRG